MGRECSHPTLRGGRRETKYSHGYPPSELEALASISEAFLPPIPLNSSDRDDDTAPTKPIHNFYQASASQYPVPDEVGTGSIHAILFILTFSVFWCLKFVQVAEMATKRGFLEARILVRALLKILSTRIGTLFICGSLSLGTEWPYLKKFSEISLEKREKVVQKWLHHCFLTPIRLAFVFLKFLVMFVFFTQVIVMN